MHLHFGADHDHHHHDHHHHAEHDPEPRGTGQIGHRLRRYAFGLAILGAGVAPAALTQVDMGEAVVITRFGDPARVLLQPGLAWRLPAPIDVPIAVDLRLRTTSSGLQDVGTKDGLRIIAQAYVAWQVPADAAHVRLFLSAVRNQPDEAARQIRIFLGSALEITTSDFDLASLVNTNRDQVHFDAFEKKLRERIETQLLDIYGIKVLQVGLDRMTLPAVTLAATVDRMRAERETVAAQRTAEGRRLAAEIGSGAGRDARVAKAKASVEAARIEAKARLEAARIYGEAYAADPQLYTFLRSLDTLDKVINPNTQIILRTDAAPFRVLIDGPGETAGAVIAKGEKP